MIYADCKLGFNTANFVCGGFRMNGLLAIWV